MTGNKCTNTDVVQDLQFQAPCHVGDLGCSSWKWLRCCAKCSDNEEAGWRVKGCKAVQPGKGEVRKRRGWTLLPPDLCSSPSEHVENVKMCRVLLR
jgi:hypothetical protein